jgi:predicted HicB family RNase H-like nuclease
MKARRCSGCRKPGHYFSKCPEENGNLTKLLWVRLTTEQHAGLKALATGEQITTNQFVRDLIAARIARAPR